MTWQFNLSVFAVVSFNLLYTTLLFTTLCLMVPVDYLITNFADPTCNNTKFKRLKTTYDIKIPACNVNRKYKWNHAYTLYRCTNWLQQKEKCLVFSLVYDFIYFSYTLPFTPFYFPLLHTCMFVNSINKLKMLKRKFPINDMTVMVCSFVLSLFHFYCLV